MITRRVVFALGSNLGDRMQYLQGAVDALFDAPGMTCVAVSPVYETEPVGGPPQPRYLNAVVVADTTLPTDILLARAQGIEEVFDRRRDVRFGPRTIDVDLIVVDGEQRDDPELTLPHPRAHERAFVLAPWRDVAPDAVVPGHGRVADLLAAVGCSGVRRRDDLVLQPPS